MIPYHKKYIRKIRWNSFHPLCRNALGLKAIKEHQLSPFIDSSCRREPDFENSYPSITAICRQEKFAPHVYQNDIIVYTTVKRNWDSDDPHYRLVAILEVIDRKETHLEGRSWYTSKELTIPSNCMVPENPPQPFSKTAGNYEHEKDIKHFLNHSVEKQQFLGERIVDKWNAQYVSVAKRYGAFIITKPIYVNVIDPPKITEDDILRIFKKSYTNTRTPNHITRDEFKEIAKIAGIDFVSK